MKSVYTYSAASGIEKRAVLSTSRASITVASGISGQIVRRTELDAPAARYFTDPFAAIRNFISKAEAALADSSRRKHHADWRGALADAQTRLEQISVTDKDKQWQAIYRITSRTGKIWTRSEVAKRAVDMAYKLLLGRNSRPAIRSLVERALDDDVFMRPLTGMVPARVVEDAAFEAFFKLAPTAPTRSKP